MNTATSASKESVFLVKFFYDVSGYISVCSQHKIANDGKSGRFAFDDRMSGSVESVTKRAEDMATSDLQKYTFKLIEQ